MPTQRVRKQPALRLVSGHEKPKLDFKVEPLFVIGQELPPLFRKHWRELGRDRRHVPLDPDWEQMLRLNQMGLLHVLTARDRDKLVGYIFTLIGPHLHYKSTRHAHIDMYWMDPDYRWGWGAVRFFNRHLDEMEKLQVKRATVNENLLFRNKRGKRVALLFKRIGYRRTDIAYRILLGD